MDEPGAMKALVKLVAWLAVLVGAVGVVFVAGIRSKSPTVLNAVRQISKATKPYVLKNAGTAGNRTAVIHHVGRTTGAPYETPIVAEPTDDGFLIALPYGPNTDWLKNVLARGAATILHDGHSYDVDRPEVVPIGDVAHLYAERDRRALESFRVEECLRVRKAVVVTQ
jgi:deazaflavin-dependent oxidoreductase (nitroreductase family)